MILPLSKIKTGQRVKLIKINAGRELMFKLATMGLFEGSEFKIIKNDLTGPVIIGIKESRIILGRGISLKLDVESL